MQRLGPTSATRRVIRPFCGVGKVIDREQAVTLRDSGSMHGTYLNNAKISSEKTLRAEDEIILGVPVYRNEHTFQPATLKVERVEFRDA